MSAKLFKKTNPLNEVIPDNTDEVKNRLINKPDHKIIVNILPVLIYSPINNKQKLRIKLLSLSLNF